VIEIIKTDTDVASQKIVVLRAIWRTVVAFKLKREVIQKGGEMIPRGCNL
jgi:hypothetical protein